MITSCALRLIVRSPDRKLVLASCWVIVLPPSRTPPPPALARRRRLRLRLGGDRSRFRDSPAIGDRRLRLERVGQLLDRHAAAAPDSISCGHQYRTLAPVPGLAPVLYMSKTAKAIYADAC